MKMTAEEYQRLTVDRDTLTNELVLNEKELKVLKDEFQVAKAKGDLSENAEFDAVKANISITEDTINNLKKDIAIVENKIANALIVENSNTKNNVIKIGDIVKIKIEGISNLPNLANGEKWRLTDTVLMSHSLIPQTKDDVGELLVTTLVGKAIIGKRWNDMPISFTYSDRSNKPRTIHILDVNDRLANKEKEEVKV